MASITLASIQADECKYASYGVRPIRGSASKRIVFPLWSSGAPVVSRCRQVLSQVRVRSVGMRETGGAKTFPMCGPLIVHVCRCVSASVLAVYQLVCVALVGRSRRRCKKRRAPHPQLCIVCVHASVRACVRPSVRPAGRPTVRACMRAAMRDWGREACQRGRCIGATSCLVRRTRCPYRGLHRGLALRRLRRLETQVATATALRASAQPKRSCLWRSATPKSHAAAETMWTWFSDGSIRLGFPNACVCVCAQCDCP